MLDVLEENRRKGSIISVKIVKLLEESNISYAFYIDFVKEKLERLIMKSSTIKLSDSLKESLEKINQRDLKQDSDVQ